MFFRSRPAILPPILMLAAISGCGKQSPPPPPPPQVSVLAVAPQSVAVTTELPGRVASFLSAEVRARVDGIVVRRLFREGSTVNAGQSLYQIDPAPYRAQLDSARAALEKAQASLTSAHIQAVRYKQLVAIHAVSQQDYDNAVSSDRQAAADVASAKAELEIAQINLGYTNVVAPITGQIGVSQVTVGAYVQASAATLLATIQKIDPVYVDVTESTVDLLRLRREAASGQIEMAGPDAVKTSLVLEDGTIYPLAGKFQFSDITVDQGTGTVTVRATFANPDGTLLPGMFVHARLVEAVNRRAFLVPEVAVSHDQKGDATALIVGPDNKVALRHLTLSRTIGDQWVVESGLAAGDRVIVEGVGLAAPGSTVTPVAVAPEPAPAGDTGLSGAE